MIKKSFSLWIGLLIVFCSNAQNISVKGIVIDGENNEPFIGANVVVKNTLNGTITDIDGSFMLEATSTDTISISMVGYVTQNILATADMGSITLAPDNIMLDQIVVVGYGTQRKVDVTGATVTVKGEELAKQPVMTATQALQGKVTGVQILSSGRPGASPNVRVRGVGTAIGGTSALFVVDGVLTDDISNINTSEIVSMDVLKDASSTAIYGARGANGVIIITTKKGAAGALKINYNNFVGLRSAARIVEMANAAEYANYASAASANAIDPGAYDTDWYKEILRSAISHQHNLSLSGGTDKSSHYVAVGYLEDEGIVLNSKYKRLNIRSNSTYKLSNIFDVTSNVSFTNAQDREVNLGAAYNNAYRAAPIIPSKIDGRYGNTSQYQNVGNPILDLENNDLRVKTNRIQASAALNTKISDKLNFRTSFGTDMNIVNGRRYNYQFLADEETFLTAGGNQLNMDSDLSLRNDYSFRWVWDNILTFNTQIAGNNFTLMGGTTAEAYSFEFFNGTRRFVPEENSLWYLEAGDANTSTNDGSGDKWARNSYLSRVNYNIDDTYIFTGTLRADGSSRISPDNRWGVFPSAGFGWVISNEPFLKDVRAIETLRFRTSWGKVGNDRIPSDAFIVTVDANQAYPFGGGVATQGSTITQVKDPNLKWETTEEFDLGLDYALFSGKLYGEIGFYTKTTRDLLINVKIPDVIGDPNGVTLTNAASIRNTGIELAANWRTKINNDLSYQIGANATFNKNKVIGLNGGEPILDGGVGAGQIYTTRTDNNQPVGSFYVYQVAGVFQTGEEVNAYTSSNGQIIQPGASAGDFKYQDINDDGRIDDNDRVFIGSYQPKAYFGINAGASYKSFDLSFDIYGNVGNYIYNGKKALRLSVNDNVEKSTAYDRWSPGSGINDEPGANGGFLPASTYYVESGDFIRLNNVSLSYNLTTDLINKLRISSARVFLTAQNLYTLQKFSGFSPELLDDSPTRAGIEINAYPTTRTIAAGINVTF